jgi:hypothetical protein
MRTQTSATKLLDHLDDWQVYRDDIATVLVRNAGAKHTVGPAVNRVANSNIKSTDLSQRCRSKDAMRFTIVRQERALRQRSCPIPILSHSTS